jgi:hypothetical protein
MAVYKTYTTVGIREDLADIIYSISPTETPFMSGVAKTKATNTSHQWQTDALAAVAANAAVEGATISYGTQSPTTKETNYTQISTKAIQVSGTNDAVTSAGRNSELAYQVAKAAKELKRDMETALLSNNAAELLVMVQLLENLVESKLGLKPMYLLVQVDQVLVMVLLEQMVLKELLLKIS